MINRHRLCTYNLIMKETKEKKKERKKKISVNLIVKETKEKKKKHVIRT